MGDSGGEAFTPLENIPVLPEEAKPALRVEAAARPEEKLALLYLGALRLSPGPGSPGFVIRRNFMRHKKMMLIIGLWILILIPGMGVSQGQKEVPAEVSGDKLVPAPEPDEDFQKARESFLKKDLKNSAEAIRRAAHYFVKLQTQAEEKREKAFFASQEALAKLADRVEKGTVKSVQELDQTFAQAAQALAQYHYLRATESWAKKETSRVGRELEAASAYLESGVKRVGGKVEHGVGTVIQDTRLLAAKLIQGGGYVNTEAEKGIKALGVEIDKLGKKVKAPKK